MFKINPKVKKLLKHSNLKITYKKPKQIKNSKHVAGALQLSKFSIWLNKDHPLTKSDPNAVILHEFGHLLCFVLKSCLDDKTNHKLLSTKQEENICNGIAIAYLHAFSIPFSEKWIEAVSQERIK